MLGISITFGITIMVVVYLFLFQLNKTTNSFLISVKNIEVISLEERKIFMLHINKLEDRIQTGDAKQAAILNKEPEPEKPSKPHKVDIGTGQGLEVAKPNAVEPGD